MVKKILYSLLIFVVPLILYLLSLETVVPIPADADHINLTEESQCFACHGRGKPNERSKDHPPKDRCFKCHRIEQNEK
jgi:hypothetical protein